MDSFEEQNKPAVSVFRSENKYLISKEDALALREKLDRVLTRDIHGESGGYLVRSLYFDSIENQDFNLKLAGVEIRKKIRIRTYSADADKCKLEVKQKNGDLQHKVSLWITREEAGELTRGNYSVLTRYFDQSPDAVYIYTVMVMGCYRPVVLVEYDRVAYTHPLYSTRITLDMYLRSSETNFDLFSKEPVYTPQMLESHVLEVKYNEKLLVFLSEILKSFHLTKCSVSKYCISRKIFYDFNF